jgi:hypothetical protein
MIIKASGHPALIVTAGLFVLFASPATAADGDSATDAASGNQAASVTVRRTVRHAWHHRRHYAHHRHHTIAKDDDSKNDDSKVADKAAPAETVSSPNKPLADIPPSVANANAQMLLAGVQLSAAAAIPPGTDAAPVAPSTANADNQILAAASDQLSDADRTLQEGNSTAAATNSSPPAPAATMTSESTAWDETSLIGKIFIGFGALLTMASAARMFIT